MSGFQIFLICAVCWCVWAQLGTTPNLDVTQSLVNIPWLCFMSYLFLHLLLLVFAYEHSPTSDLTPAKKLWQFSVSKTWDEAKDDTTLLNKGHV